MIVKHKPYDYNLRVSFTTHEIQAFTPLQTKVFDHIEQLLSSVTFMEYNVKNILNVARTKVFPGMSNARILEKYFYSFGDETLSLSGPKSGDSAAEYYKKIKTKNPHLEEVIDYRSKNMKVENNKIKAI